MWSQTQYVAAWLVEASGGQVSADVADVHFAGEAAGVVIKVKPWAK